MVGSAFYFFEKVFFWDTLMDKEERKVNQVEDMKDKMEHKELVLKMEDKEARLEELEEETDKLNKSLEIEKNERSSLESELLEVRHEYYCLFCFIIDFHYPQGEEQCRG